MNTRNRHTEVLKADVNNICLVKKPINWHEQGCGIAKKCNPFLTITNFCSCQFHLGNKTNSRASETDRKQ